MVNSDQVSDDTGYFRIEKQIIWYDRKSVIAQRLFKLTKIFEIVLSATIPFIASISSSVTAILGITIVVIEAFQHIFQWQYNWITYRATCEMLRHEKYSYLGRVGAYEGLTPENARKLLVERTENLISTEHSKWISQQERIIGKKKASSSRTKT